MTNQQQLPYPGYNWQISQHMGMADANSIKETLLAAYIYRDEPNYAAEINKYLTQADVFTENVRSDSGQSDTWRDYQQVLAETGLIVSTKLTRGFIKVTPMGLLFLDDEVLYKEMMTTQALRYQYPNGYKGIPVASREYARERGINKRWVLDARSSVNVKPAVLILRALLSAQRDNPSEAYITPQECAQALLPITNHDDNNAPYENVKNARAIPQRNIDSVLLRNCQEWFSWLSQTSLFSGDRSSLRLSSYAQYNTEVVERLCLYHETSRDSFWTPGDSENVEFDWFNYYGSPIVESFGESYDASFYDDNPDDGLKIIGAQIVEGTDADLRLSDFQNIEDFVAVDSFDFDESNYSTASIVNGITKRAEATKRHEEVVQLAKRSLEESGFSTSNSPAVDLCGERHGEVLIIEVKTVTKRNLISQTRKAVAQLTEYRFRYHESNPNMPIPETLLLLSSKPNYKEWRLRYLDELDIGIAYLDPSDKIIGISTGHVASDGFGLRIN